jgi:hypothetical protein
VGAGGPAPRARRLDFARASPPTFQCSERRTSSMASSGNAFRKRDGASFGLGMFSERAPLGYAASATTLTTVPTISTIVSQGIAFSTTIPGAARFLNAMRSSLTLKLRSMSIC